MTFSIGDLTIWTGEEGFEVYREVHKTLGNEIIHTIFLPVITFSVLRWVHLLFRNVWLSRFIIFLMFLFYSNFYALVSVMDNLVWMALTFPLIVLTEMPGFRLNTIGASLCFMIPLLIQEIIGHTLFEGANSRPTISHITNAVLYTPMFYTRGIWKGLSLLCGIPYLLPWEEGKTMSAVWIIGFGLYISVLLLHSPDQKSTKKKDF